MWTAAASCRFRKGDEGAEAVAAVAAGLAPNFESSRMHGAIKAKQLDSVGSEEGGM
jgi:hypothetical protein